MPSQLMVADPSLMIMINIASWILQILLAVFFFKPGLENLFAPKELLEQAHKLKPGTSVLVNRVLGTMQLLGCLGMILPKLLHIMPVLTAIAGMGFFVMMIGAIRVHLKDGHKQIIPLLAAVAFTAFLVFVMNVNQKQFFWKF